eukprot:m.50389 g.50389  ORF g.50389 m.50389 type:complete len:97 (+) comp7509_c0_seq3:939-1229(+)
MHDAFACTRNFVCFVVSGTPHHHIFISCPLYPTPYTALLLTMMKFLRNTLILHCDENCVWIDRPDGHQHAIDLILCIHVSIHSPSSHSPIHCVVQF